MNHSLYSFEPELNSIKDQRFMTGIPAIDELDLTRLIAKAIHPLTELEWTLSDALEISDLYRAFLFLCLKYPEKTIVPPRDVDEFWHLHILDTRSYATDCEKIFGTFLHHFPYSGLSSTEESAQLERLALEETFSLVCVHFPTLVGES